MLEPDDGKLSSPVLRGLSGRKAARLPGNLGPSTQRDDFAINGELVIHCNWKWDDRLRNSIKF